MVKSVICRNIFSIFSLTNVLMQKYISPFKKCHFGAKNQPTKLLYLIKSQKFSYLFIALALDPFFTAYNHVLVYNTS